jgi:hypothetical protein
VPASRLIATATIRELQLRAGRQVVQDWQHSHGAFSPEELARARAQAADADAELLGGLNRRDSA